MAIDNHFLLKKVIQKDELIAAFCGSTNMPFVFCDPVSFEDQVWIFADEDGFKEFAQRFAGSVKQSSRGCLERSACIHSQNRTDVFHCPGPDVPPDQVIPVRVLPADSN